MDRDTFEVLSQLELPNVSLISLEEFEDAQLQLAKKDRTPTEYCWTITPSLPLYLLRKEKIEEITYIDADLYFFSDPEPIFRELGNKSILLIEHRYTPSQKYLEKYSGRFNVQFMTFKRNKNSIAALEWWRERCIEWCYHRYEDGKLGDQLYLNDWEERFDSLHILKNIGAGVAPWNVQQYSITRDNKNIIIDKNHLIFYHFHAFQIHSPNNFSYAPGYWISNKVKKQIYQPYINQIQKSIELINNVEDDWQWGYKDKATIKEKFTLFVVALKKQLIDKFS